MGQSFFTVQTPPVSIKTDRYLTGRTPRCCLDSLKSLERAPGGRSAATDGCPNIILIQRNDIPIVTLLQGVFWIRFAQAGSIALGTGVEAVVLFHAKLTLPSSGLASTVKAAQNGPNPQQENREEGRDLTARLD